MCFTKHVDFMCDFVTVKYYDVLLRIVQKGHYIRKSVVLKE